MKSLLPLWWRHFGPKWRHKIQNLHYSDLWLEFRGCFSFFELKNNSSNLSTLSKGLLMRSANPRPASATPGTGYLYTKSVVLYELRGSHYGRGVRVTWPIFFVLWLLKTKAKVVRGKEWKLAIFWVKTLQCQSFAKILTHFLVEIIDVFWFFGTLGAYPTRLPQKKIEIRDLTVDFIRGKGTLWRHGFRQNHFASN